MAQWNGQFTGNTHGTKVSDLEQTLTHAVEVYKIASEDVKLSKARSVKKLAEKVLNARLKFVKAKQSDTIPVEGKDWEKKHVQVEHLKLQESALVADGVVGILKEFDAPELATRDS